MTSQVWRTVQSRRGMALITGVFFTALFIYDLINDHVSRSQIPPAVEDDLNTTDNDRPPHDQGATPSEIEQRFKMRTRHLKRVCSRPEYRQRDKLVLFHEYRYTPVAYRRLRWCRVAKVGTRFMKQNFFTPSRLQLVDETDIFPDYLSKLPKRFLFVRDPYSRLVSGYLDKVVTAPGRWSYFGRMVIKTQRTNATRRELECGSDVTFKEFIKYVIWAETTNRTRDIHFVPMHDLCAVCNINYDYIGHLETIREDLPFIVNSVGVRMNISENVNESMVNAIHGAFVENRTLVQRCVGIYPMMKRLWWTFQVRGLIADTIPLPASQGQVETASWDQLASWAVKAYHDTKALGSRSAQKRTFRADLFSGVPLHLRLKYLDLYIRDFLLFKFEPFPPDIFPELKSVPKEQ